ncbi:hypothetical protein [Aeromicrobium fastidiosum]|uniref:Uncharacterized protein n=1 Tax=Aeromicrobium fastidiosum TaxID=52699 RepID=A0A641AKY2_9ACTN|nr:hypothetical protein [Aeromicrobium fastidiosum]KAA1376501.1 hypothetical protein ESP62_013845 [Aeromicrobium fastidiosum]MBP2391581.1 hypothetical protein [Aeromicrobium fastidiosum]
MKTLVRAGIVTVAATVGLGTAGFAVASASTADTQEPVVVKREDTSSSWTQSTDVDDDLRDDLDDVDGVDSPTGSTVNTVNTTATKNTAPTKNTPTKNTPTGNTVKTVPSMPTKNTAPTSATGD